MNFKIRKYFLILFCLKDCSNFILDSNNGYTQQDSKSPFILCQLLSIPLIGLNLCLHSELVILDSRKGSIRGTLHIGYYTIVIQDIST